MNDLADFVERKYENAFFFPAILKRHILFINLFILFFYYYYLWSSKVYTGMVQVSYQNSYVKGLENGWVQVDPLPLVCTNGSEK